MRVARVVRSLVGPVSSLWGCYAFIAYMAVCAVLVHTLGYGLGQVELNSYFNRMLGSFLVIVLGARYVRQASRLEREEDAKAMRQASTHLTIISVLGVILGSL